MIPGPGSLVGGKYRIVRLLGEGGMGSVFEARHEQLGSSVALKFLHPDLAEKPALVARFLQEARVSAAIKSPHVTQVVDVDQTPEGEAYLVMELLEGEALDRRLERQRVLPLAEAVDIALQILVALEAAHARQVVHRDLKPDNVWLVPTAEGTLVKLLDFGIAKLKTTDEFRQVTTRPGSVMGTPAYMAPEQAISADQVDGRADLYSLGVILYEMLSGSRPIEVDDPGEILGRLASGDVEPLARRVPGTPTGLAQLVDQLVAPDPDQRPPTAAVARAALAPFGRGAAGVPRFAREVPTKGVPVTVPPDSAEPPFAASALTRGDRGQTGTASMLAVPESPGRVQIVVHGGGPSLAYAPTGSPSGHDGNSRRRGSWLVVIATGLLLVALGFGVWVLMNPSLLNDDPLPPFPTAGPPTHPPALGPTTRILSDDELRAMPPPRAPTPTPRTPTPTPRAPAPAPQTDAVTPPVGVTLPVFGMPSSLPQVPLPGGYWPVPSGFPQIPGITAPTTPSAAPSPSSGAP